MYDINNHIKNNINNIIASTLFIKYKIITLYFIDVNV